MAVQILSDLHLEAPKAYDVFNIIPKAPYLALLGNIGNVASRAPIESNRIELMSIKNSTIVRRIFVERRIGRILITCKGGNHVYHVELVFFT
jgi:hypothetical protein